MRAIRLLLAACALFAAALIPSTASAQCPMGTVAQPSLHANDVVLFADAFPGYATVASPGANWDTSQFADGSQSFVATTAPTAANVNNQVFVHQLHNPVNRLYPGDLLVAYALVDSCNPAQSITITWTTSLGYKSFYWGPEAAAGGRYYVGPLPAAGSWARLEVDPASYGLTNATYNGIIFDNLGGRVWFDHVGKRTPVFCGTVGAAPTGTFHGDDQVFWDDAFPAGATVSGPPLWSTAQAALGTQSFTQSMAGMSNGQGAMGIFIASLGPHQMKSGEKLFAYVYIDPCMPTEQINLLWTTQLGYKSAWWGTVNKMNSSGVHMGPLPAAGQWARLEVPVDTLAAGLHKKTFNGISFDIYGGRVWFDRPGKQNLPPCVPTPGQPPTAGDALDPNDLVLIEDAMPAGGVVDAPGVVWDTNEKVGGGQSFRHPDAGTDGNGHSIFLHGLNSPTLKIKAGEMLVAYALIDACAPAQDIAITWTTSIGYKTFYWGDTPASGRTRIGSLPPTGTWARLEVDADAVGLANTTYNGIIFNNLDGRVWFDHVGKELVPCTPPASQDPLPADLPTAEDVLLVNDSFPAQGVVDAPGATWDTNVKISGAQSFHHPSAGGVGSYSIFLHGLNAPHEKIRAGEKLFVYALIQACVLDPTTEVAITWTTSIGYKTFYWGTNLNNANTYMGPLPAAGRWARLEVDADTYGLGGTTYNGIIFAHKDGKVWFDSAGKEKVACTPPASESPAEGPTAEDAVLIGDAFPSQGVVAAPGATWDTGHKVSGTQSFRHPNFGGEASYSIFLHGLNSPSEKIRPGEKLIAYALIEACATYPTRELAITWTTSIGYKTFYWGTNLNNANTYMGPLPAAGVWARLEVDADAAGLANTTYNGVIVAHTDGKVWWDHVGNERVACTPPSSSAPAEPLIAADELIIDDSFPARGVLDAPGVTWDTTRKVSGTQSFHHPGFGGDGQFGVFIHGLHNPQEKIRTGEKLIAYALIEACALNPTREIAVTWTTTLGYKTFYWGTDGGSTADRFYMGALPTPGVWTRLEIDADAYGLSGLNRFYNGIIFTHYDGKVWWDAVGKETVPCTPQTPQAPGNPPLASDGVWFEDTFQAPGVVDAPGAKWDTTRSVSGTASLTMPDSHFNPDGHNSIFAHGYNVPPFVVNADDKLLFYYLTDECAPPQQIAITWTASNGYHTGWLGDNPTNAGSCCGVAMRIGDIGPGGQWHRVEVPATTLGIPGTTVNGLAVNGYGGRVWLDRIGRVCPTPNPVGGAPGVDANETLWIDDTLPGGASQAGDGAWSNAYAASGTQSIAIDGGYGAFGHEVSGATSTLTINSGETIVAYAMFNECNVPKELVLSFHTTAGEWKRAFWGTDTLYGNGMNSSIGFYRMGKVPQGNRWVKLQINPERLGLAGAAIDGFKVETVDGQMWIDRIGKSSAAPCADVHPTADTSQMWDEILISGDDTPPPGATVSANWTWDTSQAATGNASHTDGFTLGPHQHSYTGANGTYFDEWDMLSVWVMISPCDPAREIMVGTGNTFISFGENLIPVPPGATKIMWPYEPLPEPGTWFRIWLPANWLNIGNTTVTEWTFAAYDGQVWFDRFARIAAFADVTSIAADKPSPVSAGTSITFTTTATGIAPVEYQYELYNRTTGQYTIVRPYSTDNTWTWTPTAADVGNWYVYGEARNAGSQWVYEDWEVFPLTVTP